MHMATTFYLTVKHFYFLTYSMTGTFIVNGGDCLQAWTKGVYRATKRRVKRSINTDRYSVPFFFHPNAECLIEPIETVLTRNLTHSKVVKCLEMPFRFGDLTKSLFMKSFDWSRNVPKEA